jgi:hypothetical protein
MTATAVPTRILRYLIAILPGFVAEVLGFRPAKRMKKRGWSYVAFTECG